MRTEAERRVEIASDGDLVSARAEARALADGMGFSRTDATLLATAISEVARNIVVHAGTGEILLRSDADDNRRGVVAVARDSGPGIENIELAMREGHGTKDGLGLGLPGARRLVDEFEIDSRAGRGTTVTLKKWRERDELERLRENRNGSR
jgi:serine/threonine-protein kinase RsbT